MALDPTINAKPAPQPTVAKTIVSKAGKPQKLGFFENWGAALTAPKDLTLDQVKPINGTWTGLLHDLARGILVEKMPENNEPFIANISGTIQQVLLAMGTIQANAEHPVKLEDDQFIQNLTSNLLKIFLKYDLTKFKFDPKTKEFENQDKLKNEIKQLFDELLVCAGLDKEHIKNKSKLVQHLFYPSYWSIDGLAMAGALEYARAKADLPALNRDSFEKLFIDKVLAMLAVQKNLSAKSEDPILAQNEGASVLVDKFVGKMLESLRDGKLAFEYNLLNMTENKAFLNSLINKVMAKQEQGVESEEIKQAWKTLDGQLKMAMKAIVAVVLTPKDKEGKISESYTKAKPAEQTKMAADYRNFLLIQILDRLEKHKKTLLKAIETIDTKDEKSLVESLSGIIGSEKDSIKMTSLQQEAAELRNRIGISWEDEATRFIGEAWRRPTRKDRLVVLKKWEEEAAKNDKWTPEHTTKARALLKRHSLTWEQEAKQFLKKIEYQNTARLVLSQELKPENFESFIPSFFKAEDLFEEIYGFIGQMAQEVHEQQRFLEQKGAKALDFIKSSGIKKLPIFVNDLMEGLVDTVEDLAEKKEIKVGQGDFLNEIVCHLLSNENVSRAAVEGSSESHSNSLDKQVNVPGGKKFAKQEMIALSKNILMIAFETAIKSNSKENTQEAQAQAFARLIESFFENSLSGLRKISASCKELKEKSTQEIVSAVKDLSKELKVEIKLKTTDAELLEQYRELLVRRLSRELLQNLMPVELFSELLPPVLRKSGLWEMITDEMVAPYIEGISTTTDAFEALEANPIHGNQLKLAGESKNLLPLIAPITENVIEIVTEIKFSKLLRQEGDSKLKKVDFEILDDMFGNVLKQGSQITSLIEALLPPIVESVLAYHLNPKEDGKTSQQRAVEFLWNILESTQACYGKIDGIKAENLELEVLKKAFIGSEELDVKNQNETIKTYCKEMKIEREAEEILNDKEFYVWLKINREMTVSMHVLLDKVLPEDLWKVYVPKQFEKIITRDKVGAMLIDVLKEGYAHATKMREIASQGKLSLNKEDVDGKKDEVEAKALSLQAFIEQKVVNGLMDAAKIEDGDTESTRWLKEVLQLLLDKEGPNGKKPLTKMATDTAFAVFSKLLSGGLSSLNKSSFIASIEKDDPTLIGKVSKMVTLIRNNYTKLTELKLEQKCAEWSQITPANVAAFLSSGKERLKEDEKFVAISEKFEIKDGISGFKVYIKNSKVDRPREAFVEMTQFIYWETAFVGINEFIPDADWKELVPKVMRSVMTKEMVALLAVPYIHAARQIQGPLQEKAKEGKKLVEGVASDDLKVDLNAFIKEKVFNKIDEVLEDVAAGSEKLDDDLPDALDDLFKDILKTKKNLDFVDIKKVLIERVVYLLTNELFKPAAKDADGKVTSSATNETVAAIIPKLRTLLETYDSSNQNAAVIAQQLMDEVLPQAVWDEIFTGKFKDLITRKMIVDQIEKKVKEVCSSVAIVNDKAVQAMHEIKRLDRTAGLLVGRGGGLEEMYNTICKSMDETMDEYGVKKEKIAEGQPLLVNELAKGALKDPVLAKSIKKSAHAVLAVCLAKVFHAKPGQKAEERLLEVMAGLLSGYHAADPKATAKAWVNEFLPKDLLAEIVPPFLQETLNQEFFADFIEEYVLEVEATADMLNAAPKDDAEHNTSRMQGFVKATLSKYKDPSFSLDGLTGFGGFVKKLEIILTGAIAGDKESDKSEPVGKWLESFLKGSVASILSGPQVSKLLHKQFLSEAMVSALPLFGEVDVAIELPEHFELSCGKLAAEIVFPNGETDLPVPKVAQPAVFKQVQEAIGNQIGRIVNRNERILFAIDFFGVKPADKKEFQAMEDLVKATGSLGDKEKTAERMFKDGMVAFVMQKIEQSFAGWPRFFRWFAVGFVKIIAKIALKVAINRQVWNFVSDAKNDPKFRYFVWKLLNFAKSYDPQTKDEKELKKLSKDVKKAFGKGFKDMGLLKGVRSKAASGVAGVLAGQNFVDLIV